MSEFEQYANYFTHGLKITVCFPMDNNELFRDWAIVETLEEDLITLQLSRDKLPFEVHLIAGVILDLRLVKNNMGFRCSGVFIGEPVAGKIQLRLTGDVGTSELREFFRIDAYLPFRYQSIEEQNLDVLIGMWRKRKQIRVADEAARRDVFNEKHRERLFRTVTGEFDAEGRDQEINKQPDAEQFNPIDETWDNINAIAVNLSAGGFKFVTTDVFKTDEHVLIEMFIPSTPPRIMDSIARVVFINDNNSIKDDKEYFNVAFNFVLIDDRDRDAIVSHISRLESLRIRQSRQLPVYDATRVKNSVSLLKMAIWIALLAVLIYFICSYFYDYSKQNVDSGIEGTFGNAVRKYRQQTGQ